MHTLGETATWTVRLTMSSAIAIGVLPPVAAAQASYNCCKLSEPQAPVQNAFRVSGFPELVVNNISGPIHVVGDGNGEIRLTATETVRGNSDDDIARAKRVVHLDVKQDGNRILACVNGPFRHGSNSGNDACQTSGGRDEDNQYNARFDFELHVPAATKVTLSTINEGDIKVERVSGGFDLHNVNGGVELDAVTGAGDAKTVNGDVKATFAANPSADCSFATINGSVHMYFLPNLSAQLRYKTLSGDVYSDFPVAPVSETHNGVIAFRRGRFSSGQVGSGGPEIQFNTLNGNIFVHRAS
jgi:hypothetical protein